MDDVLKRHLPHASKEDAKSAGDRVLQRLQSGVNDSSDCAVSFERPYSSSKWKWAALAAAAALLIAAVFMRTPIIREAEPTLVIVETGEVLQDGPTIRANGDTGALLALADGSRVEMRSQTELSVETAVDGLRIRLHAGDIVVTAAEQRTGHLYVETSDLTVSVLGTVFLVNAAETGSRVAVIEGQVQVEHGATSKTLQPGEQVATDPSLEKQDVLDEIAWSQNQEARRTLTELLRELERTRARIAATPPPQEFAAVSVVPAQSGHRSGNIACRGNDGAVDSYGPANESEYAAVEKGHCRGTARLGILISFAYDIPVQRVVGDPLWAEQFQIIAVVADGEVATREELRRLIQGVLRDRFKLQGRIEFRETFGHALVVAPGGIKFQPTSRPEQKVSALGTAQPPGAALIKGNFALKRLANFLGTLYTAGRPVMDQTNLSGVHDITFTTPPRDPSVSPEYLARFSEELETQLGLRLESRVLPVDYLVIDHVEQPPVN